MKSFGAALSHGTIYLVPYVLTFESVDEILKGEQNKPLQVTFYPIMVVSIFITRTKWDKKDLSRVFG